MAETTKIIDNNKTAGIFASVESWIEDMSNEWLARSGYYGSVVMDMSRKGHLFKVSMFIGDTDNVANTIPLTRNEFSTLILGKKLQIFKFIA